MNTLWLVIAFLLALVAFIPWASMWLDSRPMQAIGEWLDEKLRKAMR